MPAEIGDRVLVKDQADPTQNGIYTASAGEWFRAADARTTRTLQRGTTVHTQIGSVNPGRVFEFTADEPAVGTDAITVAASVPPDIADVVEEVEALRDETQALKDAAAASAGQASASAAASAANAGQTTADRAATNSDAVAAAAAVISAQAARDASLYGKGIFPTTAAAIGFGVVGNGAITAGSGGANGTFDLAFTGGTGSGAAGRFVVAGGALTQILITAPGSYTVAPTFSFAASAGLAGAAAAAVLGRNVDVGEYFWTEVSTGSLGLFNVGAGPVAADTGVRAATAALLSSVDSLAMIEGLSVPTARLTEAAGSVSPSVYRSYSFVSGDTIEHIAIAKAGERSILQLIHAGAGAAYTANFNLEEGIVSSSSGANLVSAAITDIGSGWYECKAVVLAAASITNNVQARMSAAGVFPFTGDGTSGMYIRSIVLRKQGLPANLFPSSDPANAAFTKQNVTVTTTVSPYEPVLISLPPLVDGLDVTVRGRMTASKLVEMVGSGNPSVYQGRSVVNGDNIVWKVTAKKGRTQSSQSLLQQRRHLRLHLQSRHRDCDRHGREHRRSWQRLVRMHGHEDGNGHGRDELATAYFPVCWRSPVCRRWCVWILCPKVGSKHQWWAECLLVFGKPLQLGLDQKRRRDGSRQWRSVSWPTVGSGQHRRRSI
ncbi:hypothetical protein [Mesorhizobium sp. M0040]|uniref:phage head spike fiber domain-containing protein n=1 Tax=Mesorhizobium sp. M0040 TaxID=2956855 RepID=UPI003335F719